MPDNEPDARQPTELRLGLEWELWVIENLLEGAPLTDVVDALVARGIDRDEAHRQTAEIRSSSAFARLRQRVTRAYMAEQLVRMERQLLGPIGIDVVADITPEDFLERHWKPSRPVLCTESAREMRAVRTWSLDWVAERFGEIDVEVNTGRTTARQRSMTEAQAERMSLGDFIREITTSEGNDRYIVSRNGLLARPELRSLGADLAPLPGFLVPPELPAGVSLWVGPRGTFSPAHFDPHGVLLVQVEGRKRVRLVPPSQLSMLEDMDGFYARLDLEDEALHAQRDFDPRSIASAILEPGHALFVPVGWFHEVTSLDPSMTLSFLSFAWENDLHWVRPISAR